MNVRPIAAAVDDAATIAVSLERIRAGWGDAFETEMQQAVASIGASPQQYPRTEDGPDEPENREYFIARFEYRVIYALWKGEAVIVAVLHARQRPRHWLHRLTELD